MMKRIVLALGGNALQKKGEATAEAQKKVAIEVGEAIAELADKYEIIVAHGNGPQVGNILIHEEQKKTKNAPSRLAVGGTDYGGKPPFCYRKFIQLPAFAGWQSGRARQ